MNRSSSIAALALAALLMATQLVVAADLPSSPISPPGRTKIVHRVQVPLLDVNGLPAIDVSINGSMPQAFVIDFAANLLAVSPALARDLRLRPLGRDAMGNENVPVKNLKIGDAAFEDLVAAADPFLADRSERGVLGVNVFADVLVTVDFPHRTFLIEPGRLPPANGRDIVGVFVAEGEAPRVPVKICGTPLLASVDTAASAVLRMPASALKGLRCGKKKIRTSETVGAQSGEETVEEVVLDGDIRLGDITVSRPTCVVGQRPDVLIGAGLLRHFAVSLDLRSKSMRFSGSRNI